MINNSPIIDDFIPVIVYKIYSYDDLYAC
jgi:hypothetical protein